MPVEVNYDKGEIYIKRKNEIVKTYKFKDLVNAKQFEPVVDLQVKLQKIDKEQTKVSDEEEIELDKKWFELITSTAFIDAPTREQAMNEMTNSEMRALASEAFVFLQNWSSTEEAKLYSEQLQAITKKEPKPSEISQKSQNT